MRRGYDEGEDEDEGDDETEDEVEDKDGYEDEDGDEHEAEVEDEDEEGTGGPARGTCPYVWFVLCVWRALRVWFIVV